MHIFVNLTSHLSIYYLMLHLTTFKKNKKLNSFTLFICQSNLLFSELIQYIDN